MLESQPFNGIIEKLDIVGAPNQTLSGTIFAVKDLFDVSGHKTGAGNPDWQRTHPLAQKNAVAVDQLLNAGARLIAKTCTDELAYSLDGINTHYGTPVNPQDPTRIPGGSSSGSASVVAAGLADFALGTDTSGSIRIPAAYCGLFSMRPTVGRISTSGVIPLAPSYDTVGWLAPTADMLQRCGNVLLEESRNTAPLSNSNRLIFLKEAFALADSTFTPYLVQAQSSLRHHFSDAQEVALKDLSLERWSEAYRILQAFEVWQTHGSWVQNSHPNLDPVIEERFVFASTVSRAQASDAAIVKAEALAAVDELLSPGTILCIPTTWNLAPLLCASTQERNTNRNQNFKLTCIATLCGLPQLTLPIAAPNGLKTGISFLAAKNQDIELLSLSRTLAKVVSHHQGAGAT